MVPLSKFDPFVLNCLELLCWAGGIERLEGDSVKDRRAYLDGAWRGWRRNVERGDKEGEVGRSRLSLE